MENKKDFLSQLSDLINSHCLENRSNTPDFILANYLRDCLNAFEQATKCRDNWYGSKRSIIESEQETLWDINR